MEFKRKSGLGAWILAGLLLLLLSACSGANESGGEDSGAVENPSPHVPEQPAEPVTLTMYQSASNISNDEFQRLIAGPVKAKYPHITVETVPAQSPQEYLVSGTMPDLIFTSSGSGIYNFARVDVPVDLSVMMRADGINESIFDEYAVAKIKAESYGKMFALPFSINYSVLYYNADIFDLFGVPYPRDFMNWEETIELARRVTRIHEGKQYAGYNSLDVGRYGRQLSLPVINYETNQATLATDGWRRAYEVMRAFKMIEGNNLPGNFLDHFMKDRNTAMIVAYGSVVGMLEDLHNAGTPMNWDLVTVPEFTEVPRTAWEIDIHLLMVSSLSKHQEEAFKVASLVTTDRALQTNMTRQGRLTVLKDDEVLSHFGTELNSLQGKNKEAVFKISPAVGTPPSDYKQLAYQTVVSSFSKVLTGADINTVLREAEELANQRIAAEMAK